MLVTYLNLLFSKIIKSFKSNCHNLYLEIAYCIIVCLCIFFNLCDLLILLNNILNIEN